MEKASHMVFNTVYHCKQALLAERLEHLDLSGQGSPSPFMHLLSKVARQHLQMLGNDVIHHYGLLSRQASSCVEFGFELCRHVAEGAVHGPVTGVGM